MYSDQEHFLDGPLYKWFCNNNNNYYYYPCVRHYILFYIHGPAILHFQLRKYHEIIKIQNVHLTAILKLFAHWLT